MSEIKPTFEAAARFHGHTCPGLAFGFRVAQAALRELGISRAEDEELVAVVENDSCAVDAIQVLTGCTFGKGNLIFRDHGKQVYTFFKRSSGEALRIAVDWQPSPETAEQQAAWEQFSCGDRSPEVVALVQTRKAVKMREVLDAPESALFKLSRPQVLPPSPARILQSLRCDGCGEKVMESRSKRLRERVLCIPCAGG
ncbi:MAG: formylmethanofuran dehydrogenase [Desulfobulbaceae bacterium]|nr:formylmethanofuran dehydrogenase [Desulfobulbaceae bacterium]